ncbi:hypothetical protein LT493_03845 [Streptomyces tricolor]|nr:hypothetical protein [Streptomyces tricolor]
MHEEVLGDLRPQEVVRGLLGPLVVCLEVCWHPEDPQARQAVTHGSVEIGLGYFGESRAEPALMAGNVDGGRDIALVEESPEVLVDAITAVLPQGLSNDYLRPVLLEVTGEVEELALPLCVAEESRSGGALHDAQGCV